MGLNHEVAPDETAHCAIVLIDDDPLVGEIVRETLESAGYTVEIVENGEDAIDVIWEAQPVLAILDCALPGRPGMALLDDLRASPMFQNLPIVMLTGRRSEWHESIALKKGANAYVRKPFEARDLLITIAKLLHERHPAPVGFGPNHPGTEPSA